MHSVHLSSKFAGNSFSTNARISKFRWSEVVLNHTCKLCKGNYSTFYYCNYCKIPFCRYPYCPKYWSDHKCPRYLSFCYSEDNLHRHCSLHLKPNLTMLKNTSSEILSANKPKPRASKQLLGKQKVLMSKQYGNSLTSKSVRRNPESAHTNVKNFSCDDCKRCFRYLSHLTQHIRTHTGEKPFSCQTCKQSFSQLGNLNKHLRIHTGKKPYSCQVCKKSFIHQEKLDRHFHIHTGEKPYSCQICKKSFTHKSSLVSHFRTHTGESQ